MRTITVEQLVEHLRLGETDLDERYCLYRLKDASDVLYIGMTMRGILTRLGEHLGVRGTRGESIVGRLTRSMLPESLDWVFELYTVPECAAFVRPSWPHNDRISAADVVEIAEEWMIARDGPCLNSAMNLHPKPLNPRYKAAMSSGMREALEMIGNIVSGKK